MYYVYFLKSLKYNYRYVGYTSNLKARLDEHNRGLSKSTKPYLPFELDAYIFVKTKNIAKDLER